VGDGGTAVAGGSGGVVEVLWGIGVTLGGVDGVGVVAQAINVRSNGSPMSAPIHFDVIHASFEDRSAMTFSVGLRPLYPQRMFSATCLNAGSFCQQRVVLVDSQIPQC
jgi:hypothetical protein